MAGSTRGGLSNVSLEQVLLWNPDVIVTIDVETPARLDDRQEELLRELAALRDEESPDGNFGGQHKSMFDRLRDAFGPK